MNPINVLIADDSALMRTVLRQILESDPGIKVVGAARDGEDVVLKARELRPDVITLDINMPKIDGVTALQIIIADQICPVIMVSSLTHQGAVITYECLELGAFDFVEKPDGTVSRQMDGVAADLIAKVKAARTVGRLRRTRQESVRPKAISWSRGAGLFRAVALGISTGGPATLMDVLPNLPADINAALFLVQHMPSNFVPTFVQRLNQNSPLQVVEAKAGMVVEPGHCYVGGGGNHLGVYQRTNGDVMIRTPSKPVTLFIPSVDVMMESVLSVYGKNTIGVLMTGIGDDGADQMVAIRKAGGRTIAESSESCVVYGMPRQAIERGGVDVIAPSDEIARAILEAL